MMTFLQTTLHWISIISTAAAFGVIVWGCILWARGILPVLLRLGNGLAKRRIAVFAESKEYESLRSLLVDSKLFRKKNIVCISKQDDLGRAENTSLYLLHWPSWKDSIDKVLEKKKDGTGLVVYSPHSSSPIPNEVLVSLNKHRNTTVTNFRGRLQSDLLVSMITTSYVQ